MEQTMVRGPRSGWREDEIDQLWREIQRANASGQPLRSVFEEMGGRLGRKPNSVRNYYYMQLRGQEGDTLRRAQPFETFTEAEVRSLLDYCGLEFDERCLRFFENERAVRTASSEQVRRPIYREGVDQWRHYESWLYPLKLALGPVLDHYPAVPPAGELPV